MISDEAIREFKEIWVKHFNTEISDEFAVEQAINLLNMFGQIYRNIGSEK